MNKELLTKATAGDVSALATLRRTIPTSLTVFVGTPDNVDIDATLSAFEYYKLHGSAPDEWNDEPTLTFAQAFPAKVRRNPLTLKPITPGLWTDLWNSKSGHEIVAAVHYGITNRIIRDSEVELKLRVRRHLEAPDSLLLECVRLMNRDEYQISMRAVNAPVEQIVQVESIRVEIAPSADKRARLKSRLDELESEYNSGMLDIGRYMRLKESTLAEYRACFGGKWSHQRLVVLRDFIVAKYNLEEVKTLCFQVGVDPENIGGSGKSALVRGFIDNRQRRGLLGEVAELCKQQRPLAWSEFF